MRWRRWRAGSGLPDAARGQLGLRPDERVLTAAQVPDGSWVVATADELVTPLWRALWRDVAQAQWLPDDGALMITGVPGAFGTRRIPLDEPGRLPEAVHERVMASIVVSRKVTVPGSGGGIRVIGRRGAGDEVVWQVVPDDGVDGMDPAVQALGDAVIRQLRADLGAVS